MSTPRDQAPMPKALQEVFHKLATACGVLCQPFGLPVDGRHLGCRSTSLFAEGVRSSPCADGALRAVRRRIRGTCSFSCVGTLQPAQARLRDRRCPSRSDRGEAPRRVIARGEAGEGFGLRRPLTRDSSAGHAPRGAGLPASPGRGGSSLAARGVDDLTAVVLENRSDCRS